MVMAIKSVEMSEKESADLKKEVDVLRKLVHENIVQLYGCCKVLSLSLSFLPNLFLKTLS